MARKARKLVIPPIQPLLWGEKTFFILPFNSSIKDYLYAIDKNHLFLIENSKKPPLSLLKKSNIFKKATCHEDVQPPTGTRYDVNRHGKSLCSDATHLPVMARSVCDEAISREKRLCFYLNISTLGAYKNDITQIIEHFLQDFHPVLCDQIITVVHEAVSNAIIWSNLEVGSAWNDEPTSIFDLGYFILKRLERKTLALRRIEIAFFWSQGYLSCCVSHQGIPFHWKKCKLDEHKPYKGLSIISSLSDHVFSSQDGQSFTVMFRQDKNYDGF